VPSDVLVFPGSCEFVLKGFPRLVQSDLCEYRIRICGETELDKQIETNTHEQSRLSEIMQRLPQTGELCGDYTRELKELNAALKPLQAGRKAEFDQLEKRRRELNDYVAGLNVE